jgi:ABC-type Mn2+/Zn2+ transport system ATPase subunit
VRRLVLTGRYVHLGWIRRPGAPDYALTDTALARLGLSELAERQIGQLSGGQRQRALLARALVQGADLLLLDEPFSAMDAESRDALRDVLDQLRADGSTVLLATHELESLDLDPDAVVVLRDGRLVEGAQGLHHFALA